VSCGLCVLLGRGGRAIVRLQGTKLKLAARRIPSAASGDGRGACAFVEWCGSYSYNSCSCCSAAWIGSSCMQAQESQVQARSAAAVCHHCKRGGQRVPWAVGARVTGEVCVLMVWAICVPGPTSILRVLPTSARSAVSPESKQWCGWHTARWLAPG
jgi:hypothetical protein